MPPRQKQETPAPDIAEETHIPDPAPSPDPQSGLVDPVKAQEHAQETVETMQVAVEEPGKTFEYGDGHQCDYVEDYDFLASCNCRVPFQICRLCHTRL